MASEALKAAQQCLAIQSVNLDHGYCKTRNDFDPSSIDSETSLSQSFKALELAEELQLANDDDIQGYRFIYTLGFRLVGSEEDTDIENYEPQLEIIGSFCARYNCQRKLTEDEVRAFSENNVAYHVWPYWREYLQNMSARMGMKEVIEVPMYMIEKSSN